MSSNSGRIDSLTSSINYMWQPTKSIAEGNLADIALLKDFLGKWVNAMNSGKTNEQGYEDAISQLPKDDPNTPFNEGLTETQMQDKFAKIFDKPLNQVSDYDVNELQTNITKLTGEVRKFISIGMYCDGQIKSLQDEIDQLNQQTGDPMYGESTNDAQMDDGGFGGGMFSS